MPTLADEAVIEQELDQYWSSVAHFLAAGDYESLVTTYHPDAVLVSESLGTGYPIAKALIRWKPALRSGKLLGERYNPDLPALDFEYRRRFVG